MTLKDLASIFQTACVYSFNLKKLLFLFLVLAISGCIYLFFQGISLYFTNWMRLPLSYLPLFLVSGLLLAAEAFLLELYQQERREERPIFRQVLWGSWEIMLRSSYLALTILITFLLLWVLLALFIILKAIPWLGLFFAVVLAFGPFLINLGILALTLCVLFLFFFVIPSYVINKKIEYKFLIKKFHNNLFVHLFLLGVALLPVWIAGKIIGKATVMTLYTYSLGENQIMTTLQLFFVMLPIMILMTPAVHFFFNFALESYWVINGGGPHRGDVSGLE